MAVEIHLEGATSRFAHIEKVSLNFSNSSFVIRVNLLHPWPSLFLHGLSLSLWCFSILLNCYFQVSYHVKVILHVAKITQNTVTDTARKAKYSGPNSLEYGSAHAAYAAMF